MRSLCVEAPISKGEEVRRRLLEAGLLRKGLRIEREGDRLYIPVTAPEGLGPLLPKAFDSIGDIVVLRLEDALRPHERAIGEAILRWDRKARTVAVDEGVQGEHRIRKVRVIAGEPR